MRAIWKGSISFGLVNIPIALYAGTRREELKFRLLRDTDLSPVNYKRVAETDGKEVDWEHIVKGYEYEKGKFVVLEDEDFKRVDVESTQTVDILEFADLKDIDPMYFEKPFYMEPQKGGEKAYALLREALKDTGKVGIAKVVIKTRQYLAAVKPQDEALVLELMHFQEELVEPKDLNIPGRQKHLSKKEIQMAEALIESMSGEWHPEKYKDDYRNAVLHLIEEKVKLGGKTPPAKETPKRPSSNVIDLVSVLQKSLDQTKSAGKGHKHPPHAHKRHARKAA
jgi:DNA end-binding protein Ku